MQQWQEAFPAHTTAKTDLTGHVTLRVRAGTGRRRRRPVASGASARGGSRSRLLHDAAPRSQHRRFGAHEYGGRQDDLRAAQPRHRRPAKKAAIRSIDSPAVELILSMLKLADHPGDGVARFHLATRRLPRVLNLTTTTTTRRPTALSQQLRRQLLDDGYGATRLSITRGNWPQAATSAICRGCSSSSNWPMNISRRARCGRATFCGW